MLRLCEQQEERLLYKIHRPLFGWESELPPGFVSIMCDSGACLSACPKEFASSIGLDMPTRFPGSEFIAANGTRIGAEASRVVNLLCTSTDKAAISFGVRFETCNVHRPILSVGEVTARKHTFILSSPKAKLVMQNLQEVPLLSAGGTFYLVCRLAAPAQRFQ
jgi:hypothetical protein